MPFLPASAFYDRLTQNLIDADQHRVLWSILSAYQDVYQAELDILPLWQDVNSPLAPRDGDDTYAVTFAPPELSSPVTVYIAQRYNGSIDPALPDLQWAADILAVPKSCITNISIGPRRNDALTSKLRADLLASYGGVSQVSDQAVVRKMIDSLAKRLAWKSTPACYNVIAQCYGYDRAVFIPLWSRLSCRRPDLPGSELNLADFSSLSEVNVELNQDSRVDDFRDGDLVTCTISPIVNDQTSTQFWTTAVNGKNPFLSVSPSPSLVSVATGNYSLSGGGLGLPARATVLSQDGTPALVFSALIDGESFNGLEFSISALENGYTLTVTDQLSAIKFRSSYFDLFVVQDWDKAKSDYSRSLRSNSDLVNSGQGRLPYSQAGLDTEIDIDSLIADSQAVFNQLDAIRPITRFVRRSGIALSSDDIVQYGLNTTNAARACYDYSLTSSFSAQISPQSGYYLVAWLDGAVMPALAAASTLHFYNADKTVKIDYNLVTGALTLVSGSAGQLHLQWENVLPPVFRDLPSFPLPEDEIDDRAGMAWYDGADSYLSLRPITGSGIATRTSTDATVLSLTRDAIGIQDVSNSMSSLGLSPVSDRKAVLGQSQSSLPVVAHYGNSLAYLGLIHNTPVLDSKCAFYSAMSHWFALNSTYPDKPVLVDAVNQAAYADFGQYTKYGAYSQSFTFSRLFSLDQDAATCYSFLISPGQHGYGQGSMSIFGQTLTCNGYALSLNGTAVQSDSPVLAMIVVKPGQATLKYASTLTGTGVWTDELSLTANSITSSFSIGAGCTLSQFASWGEDASQLGVRLWVSTDPVTPVHGRDGLTSAEYYVDSSGKAMLGRGEAKVIAQQESMPVDLSSYSTDLRFLFGLGASTHLNSVWSGYTGDGYAVDTSAKISDAVYARSTDGKMHAITLSKALPKTLIVGDVVNESGIVTSSDFRILDNGGISHSGHYLLHSRQNLVFSRDGSYDLVNGYSDTLPSLDGGKYSLELDLASYGSARFPILVKIRSGSTEQVISCDFSIAGKISTDLVLPAYAQGCDLAINLLNQDNFSQLSATGIRLYQNVDQVYSIDDGTVTLDATPHVIVKRVTCAGSATDASSGYESTLNHLTGSSNDCDELALA